MSYSSTFKVHFSRYSSRTGRRLRSRAQFLSAGSIDEAFRIANAILTGLKNDETHEYCIQSIENDGMGGEDADDMAISMFAEKPEPEEQA